MGVTKAVVLLSGGQDSTTTLYWAKREFDEVHAVSFDYGQRHKSELDAASQIGKFANVVSHPVFSLEVLSQLGDSALTSDAELKASGGLVDKEMPEGLPTSFVPGRNILFLTVAAAYAAKIGANDVVTGVCQTDYSGYPDCRESFVRALDRAIKRGFPSSCRVHIQTPLMFLSKKETVELAMTLPDCYDALSLSITCYEGKRPGCGKCPACELRAKGFKEAGVTDPAEGSMGAA